MAIRDQQPKTDTQDHRHQNEPDAGREIPGDTDASDIVGRTGEEMPDVAHDETNDRPPDGSDLIQRDGTMRRE